MFSRLGVRGDSLLVRQVVIRLQYGCQFDLQCHAQVYGPVVSRCEVVTAVDLGGRKQAEGGLSCGTSMPQHTASLRLAPVVGRHGQGNCSNSLCTYYLLQKETRYELFLRGNTLRICANNLDLCHRPQTAASAGRSFGN